MSGMSGTDAGRKPPVGSGASIFHCGTCGAKKVTPSLAWHCERKHEEVAAWVSEDHRPSRVP